MNYGLYLSAGGVLTNLHRQDVLANNLANAETTGFKPNMVQTRQRLPERLESTSAYADQKLMLEQLGGGQFLEPSAISGDQGRLDVTQAPLDLAIEGRGFFTVASEGSGETRFTRDGRFTIGRDGTLVTAAGGLQALDDQGRPIHLGSSAELEIDARGRLLQGGRLVATLGVVDVPVSRLVKTGNNLHKLADGAATAGGLPPATGNIRQGFLETSAVDSIKTLTALIGVTKAAQANAKLMQYHDHIIGQTVGTYARVA